MKTKSEISEYNKKWRLKLSKDDKRRIQDIKLKRRIEIREWFLEYKKRLKCLLCPENHTACLDFHHKNSSEKIKNVSYMVARGWSRERIMEEVEKCEVLCANCHRRNNYRKNK